MHKTEGRMIDWLSMARRIERMAASALLALLVAIALVVLGAKLHTPWLLYLSKWVAAAVAVLEFAVATAETSLVYRTWRYSLRYWKRMHRADARLLWRALRQALQVVMVTWPLVFAAICLPLIIDMPARVPTSGLMFAVMMLMFGLQYLNMWVYRRLAALVDQSLQAPVTHTFAA